MGADLASWYDTITSVRDVQNHETLAYRQIWYETLLLAHTTLRLFALKVYDDSRAVLEAETGRTGVEQIRWSTPVKWTVSHLNSVRSQTPAGSFLPRRAAFMCLRTKDSNA